LGNQRSSWSASKQRRRGSQRLRCGFRPRRSLRKGGALLRAVRIVPVT
jgi:hypothetical protein